jgi:hypothetical protein
MQTLLPQATSYRGFAGGAEATESFACLRERRGVQR